MAILQSVNVGQPRPIPGARAETGIYKESVEGEVTIMKRGLDGDAVMDRKHHGGVDQAVYVYFADDYRWWAEQLGHELPPGTMGENLTIAGVEGRSVAVGDRFTMDEVVLEVTSHRTPCMTFARKMGDPGWVRRFHKAGRPGAYCRVVSAGAVHAGEPVRHTPFAGERITVSALMALDGVREIDQDFLLRALSTPLHYKMREDYEARLSRLL
jgi:MOSC domain-containing protein YiiM